MAQTTYDLIVIGSGPGGYTGAIRAAQLGFKVAVIEKDKTLGGTCLNVGCIPSKALLESSEHFEQAQHDFKGHGIDLGSVNLNLPQMLARKDKIVKELTGGISFLFKKNKIDWIQGLGALKSATEVLVKKTDGAIETLSTRFVMLATGSVPVELPFMKFNGQTIISSTEALSLPKVPKHIIVVGAGFIGLELGSVWMRLGAKVTVLEFASKICGPMDNHISSELEKILKRQGMNFELEARVTGAEALDSSTVRVAYDKGGEKKTVEGDVVLVSVGRRPFSEGVGLDAVGVSKDDKGRVVVNEHYQTNVSSIYAIGDLIAGPMLAHKAEEEGVAVAEILAGKAGHVNYETVPSVIYTWPEVASVGATEEQLKEANIPYNVGKFPFAANARAKALGSTDGLVKVLAHQVTDRLLGVHIIGPRASDMLAEAVVAMEFGGSAEDLARSFHAHPTLSEVMREAALAVDKRARQI